MLSWQNKGKQYRVQRNNMQNNLSQYMGATHSELSFESMFWTLTAIKMVFDDKGMLKRFDLCAIVLPIQKELYAF